MSPAASSRWCPTPEQLVVLEELYRNGVRTPKASQIQRITAHLSLYGKIEGKNVFYWFQNHKARERQRLRRKLIKQLQCQHFCHPLYSDAFFLHSERSSSGWADCAHTYYQGNTFGGAPRGGMEGGDSRKYARGEFMMRMNGCDWMLKVGPSNSTKPLETLQLFPIRSNDFKHE